MGERIVVTGIGVVSAIGHGREEFAMGLGEDRCGIEEVTAFDVERCRNTHAAEIIDLDVTDFLESEKNYLDRNSELGFVAARLALDDAGFRPNDDIAPRFGICLGTAYGNVDTMHSFHDSLVEKGAKLVSPFLFQHTYNNTTASLLAIEYSIRGVHANFCSGPAAGAEAILYALDSLRLGRADAILAGGVEALSEVVFKGMDSADPMAIPGEGAALLMLEPEGLARKRGAAILGVILGGGAAGGLREAGELALADAGLQQKDVEAVFGPNMYPDLPTRRVEELLGHTVGASGALAAAAALVSGRKRAMVNSCGAGLCVSLILGKE